ncbi:hypothetical protein FQR65_LT07821 [Abscondita terminalis]|nr:hypothetical protein FQR65_LT07821 [Abscondita terminalis]
MGKMLIVLLTIFGLTNSLTIDSQVNVVRNDCYERLALGQKLKPQDVDKKLEVTTVQECQMACTEEEEKCRSFSFGIGVKGNGTCELSRTTIKETPDLKPIGTITEVDYDLYIKKLGCKLVISQNPIPEKPTSQHPERPTESSNYPYSNETNIYSSKPYRVKSSYISVASNPNSPSTTRYGTGKPYKVNEYSDDRPPFGSSYEYGHRYPPRKYASSYQSHFIDRVDFDARPEKPDQHHSYKPDRIDDISKPDYTVRPHGLGFMPDRYRRPPSNFNYQEQSHRPDRIPERPPYDDGYNPIQKPYRPVDSSSNYGSKPFRPDRIPTRPEHSNDYSVRPQRPYIIPNEPNSGYESDVVPLRPIKRPSKPIDYFVSYDIERPKPLPDSYSSRPHAHNQPNHYDSIPERPIKIPSRPEGYDRPKPPSQIFDRPDHYDPMWVRPEEPERPNDYNLSPNRPIKVPQRPDNYGFEPYRPESPIKIPERPGDYGSGPHGPERPIEIPDRPNEYGSGPYGPDRPIKVSERPGDYGSVSYGSERPIKVHERPDNYGPERPIKVSERPGSYGSGSYGPDRPVKIPERPDNYGSSVYGPERPIKVPGRPDDYSPGSYGPERPIKVPVRPYHYGSGSYGPERPINVPDRPDGYDFFLYNTERPIHDRPSYGVNFDRPEQPEKPDNYFNRPSFNRPQDYNHDLGGYGPVDDFYNSNRPDNMHDRPFDSYKPNRPNEYESLPVRPNRPVKGDYGSDIVPYRPYDIPNRPDDMYTPYHRPHVNINALDFDSDNLHRPIDRFDWYDINDRKPFWSGYDDRRDKPRRPSIAYDHKETKEEKSNASSNSSSDNTSINDKSNDTDKNISKIDNEGTQMIDPSGDKSTIEEIKSACFRRVLAGKRILRAFVRKAVPCERVEECQRECSDERRFVCEGFNYRLDPTGRGQGDCELIDLPLSRLDIRRDVISDADYDYYERDRNSDAPDCKGVRYYGSYSTGKHDYYDSNRRGDYHYDNYNYDSYNYRHRQPGPDNYDYYDYYYANRRGDYKDYEDYGYSYNKPEGLPHDHNYPIRPHYDDKSYEPYLPPQNWKFQRPFSESDEYWKKYFEERVRDKNHWGFKEHKGDWGSYGGSYGNFGAPDSYFYYDHPNKPKYNISYKKYYDGPYESKDWGRYGGTYGYEDEKYSHTHKDSYDYWGFKKYNDGLLPPYQSKPEYTGSYLPPYETGYDYMGIKNGYYDRHQHDHGFGDYQSHIKDQCSLRMAAGFRLHKGIIKKITSVPNIYECEILCYKERDFPCASYAFRYTVINNVHKENCYLSDRSFRELDYYTDLEPDRDYDIYTINNKNTCLKPPKPLQEKSDCFWRVRSGQRLDNRIVKDSITVKSIVDCQLQCLKARTFTCRGYSYRYGPPVIGGSIDNCQLTDWPSYDLNPHVHFVSEPGYEIYDRGSYGYGCEANHIQIGHKPKPTPEGKMDQVCYLKYGISARLLPQATKKSIVVPNEIECKAECTRAREKGNFQCMSFSYRLQAVKGTSNCDLSDILQRDLLSNVDYVPDPDAWLFAWDLHNPNCVSVIVVGSTIFGGESIVDDHGGHHKEEDYLPWHAVGRPQDTWKVYSVNGLPCKRGSFCQENKVAGFWYCELENKEEFSWDYCCNPEHHCGYSEGFPYQWCYVGPRKSQWRKCNDHYYPYGHSETDRYDYHHPHSYLPGPSSNHVPDYSPSPQKPSFRPDRPPPDDYFLDPLNRLPQNNSLPEEDSFDLPKAPKSRNIDTSYQAIGNLIETIKSNELKKLQESNNDTNKTSDSLYVKIPLPSNITNPQVENTVKPVGFETVDISSRKNDTQTNWQRVGRNGRVYARSYITKTNKTLVDEEHRKSSGSSS